MTDLTEVFLKQCDVAKIFKMSRSTFWKFRKNCKDFPKPVTLLGGRQLFKKSDILQYIEKLQG